MQEHEPRQPIAGSSGEQEQRGQAATRPESEAEGLEPLTMSLLGRLFGVPMLIVATIVGGAVLVVVLFGGSSIESRGGIDSLLQELEANSGVRSMGILLPKEKELWQTALELSERLRQKDKELDPAELDELADRLAAMIKGDIAVLDEIAAADAERAEKLASRGNRIRFLILALGRTDSTRAVDPLIDLVRNAPESFAQMAILALGNLHEAVPAGRAIEPILQRMNRATDAALLLTACPALAALAEPGDQRAIEGLRQVYMTREGEVSWSASLALARLGSDAGKSTVMDLMDRDFWEKAQRHRVTDGSGAVRTFDLPPDRVDAWLMAAMEAAAHLPDADLWKMIEELKSDASLAVRARAEATLRQARPEESPGQGEG